MQTPSNAADGITLQFPTDITCGRVLVNEPEFPLSWDAFAPARGTVRVPGEYVVGVAVSPEGGACLDWLGSVGEGLSLLDLSESRVPGATLPWLAQLRDLRSLVLADQEVGDEDLQVLSHLVRLERLDLSGTRMTDEALLHLTPLRRLRHLRVSGTYERVTGRTIDQLAGRCPLRELDAHDTDWTDGAALALSAFPTLVDVDLSESHISDAGLAAMSRLHRLESIYLDLQALVTDAGLRHLSSLRRLRSVALTHTGVGPEALAMLPPGRMERLSLGGTQVDDRGLEPLPRFRELLHLDLSSTPVTPASAHLLAECHKLRSLNLRDTGFERSDLATLRGAMPSCSITGD